MEYVKLSFRFFVLIMNIVTLTFLSANPLESFTGIIVEKVLVDMSGPNNMHTKATGDFGGDGFIDLLVAGTGGEIYWYEYPDWQRYTIATAGGGWSTDAETGDIDGDGDTDLVISSWYQDNRLVWFENPLPSGNPRTTSWALHGIGSPRAHDIELGDLDGDGTLDIVTRQQDSAGKQIVIWRQHSPTSWSSRTISSIPGEGLHLGDLDSDGDKDIIIGGRWYENTRDILGDSWSERIFASNWTYAETLPWMADINGDGRRDVVLSPSEPIGGSHRVSWYEGPADPKSDEWIEHIIDCPVETVLHSLGAGDMNGDGRVDVVTAEMHQGADPDEVRIYFNNNDSGTSWSKQVVDTGGSHSIRLIDIGTDGDLDIFGANWSNDRQVKLWENLSEGGDATLPLNCR